jgi:hypothetical protein
MHTQIHNMRGVDITANVITSPEALQLEGYPCRCTCSERVRDCTLVMAICTTSASMIYKYTARFITAFEEVQIGYVC